jgi:hypothetical protein
MKASQDHSLVDFQKWIRSIIESGDELSSQAWLIGRDGPHACVSMPDLDAQQQRYQLQELAIKYRCVTVHHAFGLWFSELSPDHPRYAESVRFAEAGELDLFELRREMVRILTESVDSPIRSFRAEIFRAEGEAPKLGEWKDWPITLPYAGFRRYLPRLGSSSDESVIFAGGAA